MVDYTDTLRYYSENSARGTPYMTGFTLDPNVNTGNSFGTITSETFFVKNVMIYVESGTSFSSVRIRYPNLHTTNFVDHTETGNGYESLQYFCENPKVLNGDNGEHYKLTGNPYFAYELAITKPIVLKASNSDYLHVGIGGLSGGIVECKAKGWRVLETDDEV